MESTNTRSEVSARSRALRILAKSVYRELKSGGHSSADIVAFTTELLDVMSLDMRDELGDDEVRA